MSYFNWNPWHGCHKISEGCRNCYVYRQDGRWEKDSSAVTKTQAFAMSMAKNRKGEYKIPSGSMVYTCFTSDFLLEDADQWRTEAWKMIHDRQDVVFFFITKRIDRLNAVLPDDWNDGYENVVIGCTVENQERADFRLPIFLSAKIKHKIVICAPILGEINISKYLKYSNIEELSVGGESGEEARVCNYDWVLTLSRQSKENGIPFSFHQTGARLLKDGKEYRILRKFQHSQARKAGLNTVKRLI
ncbi:MAG: DUF5131 family protein [Flavobacteriales bacterium]|nr:DUF5131 family protein [Flavobacteriales bacterium]